MKPKSMQEKTDKCIQFFKELVAKLGDNYEVVGSCNHDISRYLCPVGTIDKVTYTSKPELSFRISDHWNWFSNVKKCPYPNYIQCYTHDLPGAHHRQAEGLASTPIKAVCVGIFIDGRYHIIFGETYNRLNRRWCWIESDVDAIVNLIEEVK